MRISTLLFCFSFFAFSFCFAMDEELAKKNSSTQFELRIERTDKKTEESPLLEKESLNRIDRAIIFGFDFIQETCCLQRSGKIHEFFKRNACWINTCSITGLLTTIIAGLSSPYLAAYKIPQVGTKRATELGCAIANEVVKRNITAHQSQAIEILKKYC